MPPVPYRQLIFQCENLSCLHFEPCGEAHLWASYLRREEVQKDHHLCNKIEPADGRAYHRLSDGRHARILHTAHGLDAKAYGLTGLKVALLLHAKDCNKIDTPAMIIGYDPRIVRLIKLLERGTAMDYKFHSDMPFWKNKGDVAFRQGFYSAFSDINYKIRYVKENLLQYIKDELQKALTRWESYQQQSKDNHQEWVIQSRTLPRDKVDNKLLYSNPWMMEASGKIRAFRRIIRLIETPDRDVVMAEAKDYIDDLANKLRHKIQGWGVKDWKPVYAKSYTGSWHYPKGHSQIKSSRWSYPL